MASRCRATARAMRQLTAAAGRAPTARAATDLAGTAAARTLAGARANTPGSSAQQTVRRLLMGDAPAGGSTMGGRFGASTSSSATRLGARSLAAAAGPAGTRRALAAAKALLHADREERMLLGEGDDLEDT
jgi:hypothetical protein